jgi:hypothetical protein
MKVVVCLSVSRFGQKTYIEGKWSIHFLYNSIFIYTETLRQNNIYNNSIKKLACLTELIFRETLRQTVRQIIVFNIGQRTNYFI